jgi:streptogramin lyase
MKRAFYIAFVAVAVLSACHAGSDAPVPSAQGAFPVTASGIRPHHVYSAGCNPKHGVKVGTVTEYAIPSALTSPRGVAVDANGAVWFETSNGYIGKFTQPATWNSYKSTVPSANLGTAIAIGNSGNAWFTAVGVIGKVTASTGAVTTFPLAISNGGSNMDETPAGLIYVSGQSPAPGEVASVTGAGVSTLHTAPAKPVLVGVSSDSTGNVWYTDRSTGKIYEELATNPATFKSFAVSGAVWLAGIAEGPPGTGMWFVDASTQKVGNVSPTGVVTQWASGGNPYGIVGACGNMWFIQPASNQIGEITPGGVITEYPAPANAGFGDIEDIAADPNGNVWFDDTNHSKLAMIQTAYVPTPTPSPTTHPTSTPTTHPTSTPTTTPTATPTPPLYPSVVLADGPSQYFHLDSTGPTGSTIADVSGRGNNATSADSPIGLVPGGILNWNDTASDLTTGTEIWGLQYQPTVSAFSVEAWVKINSPSNGNVTVYGGDAGSCPNIFELRVNEVQASIPVYATPGTPVVHIGQDGGVTGTVGDLSTATVNDGNWHHLVATWSAAAGAAVDPTQFHIYVDGNDVTGSSFSTGTLGLVAPITFNSTSAYPPTTACNSSIAPGWVASGTNTATDTFDLDELATYEYALTPAQVQRHYQVGSGEASSARHRKVRHRSSF